MQGRKWRALAAATIALCATAAQAQARPSLVVEAGAVGSNGGFEQMRLDFECMATDPINRNAFITDCSIGGLRAYGTSGCFECVPLLADYAVGSGTVRLGGSYTLCVAASSFSAAGWQSVRKCAPLDPTTFTAVVAG